MTSSLPLRITFDQESDSPAMDLHVQAGNIRMEIHIPDATQPVPIDADDKALMQGIRSALLKQRAPLSMLDTPYGAYFLWALAQHVRYSPKPTGATVQLAGLELMPTQKPPRPFLPSLTEIVVE